MIWLNDCIYIFHLDRLTTTKTTTLITKKKQQLVLETDF